MAYLNNYERFIAQQEVTEELLGQALEHIGVTMNKDMREYGMKLAKGEKVLALTDEGRKLNEILNGMKEEAESAKEDIAYLSGKIEALKAKGKSTKEYERDLKEAEEKSKLPSSINIEGEGDNMEVTPAKEGEGYELSNLAGHIANLLTPSMNEKDTIAYKRAISDYEKSATRVALASMLQRYVS